MKRINVALGERSYPIYIGYNIFSQLPKLLQGIKGKGIIVTDHTVKRLWGPRIERILRKSGLKMPIFSIKPGEASKSLDTAERIYHFLLKNGIDRKGFIIAIGGGVVGDLAGFVAANYMRGISVVQIPTTLMAQVDSSIGGKTGVNLNEGKNLVGSFWQPKFVFMDIQTLTTLPKRYLRAGIAEVIKYGVIKDKTLFLLLEKKLATLLEVKKDIWQSIIWRCAKIKADVVSKDECETKGLRVILNYGHTIGHAVESLTKYHRFSHGEAVALGMVAVAKLAHKMGYLGQKDLDRQICLITGLGLPVDIRDICRGKKYKENIIKKLKYDKKNKDGKIRFVLARRIGEVIVANKIKDKDIKAVLS